MHIITTLILILVVWKWGDWKNINNYLPTMWYVGSMNLLYHLISDGFWLWKYQSSWLSTKEIAIIHTFIVLPSITFLYISHLPNQLKHKLFYAFSWIIGSFLWSIFVWGFARLSFHNGYKIWMDLPFYVLMFGFITLHLKRPFITYFLSIIVITNFILIFKVPW